MLHIRQSSQACHDIVEITLFIARDNLGAADAFAETIERKLQMLASYPELGQSRPELGDGLRCLAAGAYMLIYRSTSEAIELLRVIHAARDVDALF